MPGQDLAKLVEKDYKLAQRPMESGSMPHTVTTEERAEVVRAVLDKAFAGISSEDFNRALENFK